MSSFRTIELSDSVYETNGLRFLTIKTPNLMGRGDICLFVPQGNHSDLPIYLLLHGVYGSAWIWAMKGGAHVTAKEMMDSEQMAPAIIAMPSDGLWGDGSAYFDHHAKRFEQWIVHDVPQAIVENIPEATENSSLCIGGLSMGGYGALRLGGLYPNKFKAISAHSSITQLTQMSQFVEEPIEAYLTSCTIPNVIDIFQKNRDHLPPIRFDCGKQDPLIEANRLLHQQMSQSGIDHTYVELNGGHEWSYWINNLKRTYSFFDQIISSS